MNIRVICLLLLLSVLVPLAAEEPAIYYKGRGDYLYSLKQYAPAIIAYQKALTLDPGLLECHFKLGKIYQIQKHFSFAINEFSKLLDKKKIASLINRHLVLDSCFELARTHRILCAMQADKTLKQTHMYRMQQYLSIVTNAFKDPFFSKQTTHYKINKHYYLYKAYFILGGLARDLKQPLTPSLFLQARIHLFDLVPGYTQQAKYKYLQKAAYSLIKQRIAECDYYLWEYYHQRKNTKLAAFYREKALNLDPKIFKRGLAKPMFPDFYHSIWLEKRDK